MNHVIAGSLRSLLLGLHEFRGSDNIRITMLHLVASNWRVSAEQSEALYSQTPLPVHKAHACHVESAIWPIATHARSAARVVSGCFSPPAVGDDVSRLHDHVSGIMHDDM
jgi:hypothetical protein